MSRNLFMQGLLLRLLGNLVMLNPAPPTVNNTPWLFVACSALGPVGCTLLLIAPGFRPVFSVGICEMFLELEVPGGIKESVGFAWT